MSYLDELLAGYRQGLADYPLQPVQALRAALAEASDPRHRGALLGLLARALVAHAGQGRSMNQTLSRA